MPLRVVSSILCNDLRTKALSKVCGFFTMGRDFLSQLSYDIRSLMASLATWHMALWALSTRVSISYYKTAVPAMHA